MIAAIYMETVRARQGYLQSVEVHLDRVRRTLSGEVWKKVAAEMYAYEADVLSSNQRISFIYDEKGNVLEVRAVDYQVPAYKQLKEFAVPSDFSYDKKYADRRLFDQYINACSERECPLFVREGLLTDTHFSNIVLQKGYDFYTPRLPLLKGTMRDQLLRGGVIVEKDLTTEDLYKAEVVHLINAMNSLNDIVIR